MAKRFKLTSEAPKSTRSWNWQTAWFEDVGFDFIFGQCFMQSPENRDKYQRIITPSGRWLDPETMLGGLAKLQFGNREQIEILQAWEYHQEIKGLSSARKSDIYQSEDEYWEGKRLDYDYAAMRSPRKALSA